MNERKVIPRSEMKKNYTRPKTFFEKRVDAIVSLIAPQKTCHDKKGVRQALIANFNDRESTSRSLAETWVLAIRKTSLDANLFTENDLRQKLEHLTRTIKEREELSPHLPLFVKKKREAAADLRRLEGHPVDPGIKLRLLQKTDSFLLMELQRRQGSIDPLHMHPDHETSSILVSGALKVRLADEVYHAEPGDSWLHKIGVLHQTEALEDSVQICVKAPPVKTW